MGDDPTPPPSQEALEAARDLFEDIEHDVQGGFTQRERARKEIAFALDRFRAAERERLQAIIHSLCPYAKNNWCRRGMLYDANDKAMGACEWSGHIAGGYT